MVLCSAGIRVDLDGVLVHCNRSISREKICFMGRNTLRKTPSMGRLRPSSRKCSTYNTSIMNYYSHPVEIINIRTKKYKSKSNPAPTAPLRPR